MAYRANHRLTLALDLRPSEALALSAEQVIPPSLRGSKQTRLWSIVLHPRKENVPSKTSIFNESLLKDGAPFPWLSLMLQIFVRDVRLRLHIFATS